MNFSTKAETRLYSSFKPQTNVFNECQIGSKIYTGKISMTLVNSENIFSQKLVVEVDGIFYERNIIIDENIASSKEMNYSDLVGVSFRVIKTLKYDGKEDIFSEKFKIEYRCIPIFQYKNRKSNKRKIKYGSEYHPYQRTDFNFDINLLFWSIIGMTNKEIIKWLKTSSFTIKKKTDLFFSNLKVYLFILRLSETSISKQSSPNSKLINGYDPLEFINKLYGTKFSSHSNLNLLKTFFMIDENKNFNLMTDPEFPKKTIYQKSEVERWLGLNTLVALVFIDSFKENLYRDFSEYFQFKELTSIFQVIYNDT